VNREEAKQILALFRPGTADERDPFFSQALEAAKADPEIQRWFHEQCESYLAVRERFRTIPVPAGLKEQILSERKVQRMKLQTYWRPVLAASVLAAFVIGLIFGPSSTDRYAAYRKRMTETALRSYYMDLTSSNPAAIRNFLGQRSAPANYDLPAGLKAANAVGCAVESWQGKPVSMICLKSGRPLPAGSQSDLWLFVIDRKAAASSPPQGQTVFARVNKATTVSWSDTNNTYLLAAVGDEAFLRKYVQ
jgi:hypothetical protein